MSIDAVIERIHPRTPYEGLRLVLAPRVDSEGKDTCAGRTALNLIGARTFAPEVGMEIWGGASSVEIVGGPDYDRKGSFLRERRPCLLCGAWMRWAEISDEITGARRECFLCSNCGEEQPC